MGFWFDIAKGLAADYIGERGAKGTLEDLGNLANGVKNFFTGEDFSQSGNFNETYDSLMEQEKYGDAINFVDHWYKGESKDYLYYYYKGNAEYELALATTDYDMIKTALKSMSDAYRYCPIGTEDSSFIRTQRDNIKDMKEFLEDNNDTYSLIDQYIESKKYSQAIETLNKYYAKHFDRKRDYSYYNTLGEIYFFQLLDADDINKNFSDVEFAIKRMEDLAENEDHRKEIKANKDYIYRLKSDQKVALFRREQAYDKAIRQIEDCYSSLNNKDDNNKYWSDLFENYMDALKIGMRIGRNKEEDILMLRKSLAQQERLDNGSNKNELAEKRKLMEELIASLLNYKIQNPSPKADVFEKTDNPVEVDFDSEQEYITELKECYADGVITDRERRLLDKLRKSLGISEDRAKELEAQCNPNILSKEEEEYAEEVKAVLEDGVITEKERRLLNRLAKSLNISEDRVKEIENRISK